MSFSVEDSFNNEQHPTYAFKTFAQNLNTFGRFDLKKWNWKVIQCVIASDQIRVSSWGPSQL